MEEPSLSICQPESLAPHWCRRKQQTHDPFGINPHPGRSPPPPPPHPLHILQSTRQSAQCSLRHSATCAPVDTELRRLIVTLVPAGIMEKGSRRPTVHAVQSNTKRNQDQAKTAITENYQQRPPSSKRTLLIAACIIPSIGPLSYRHSVLLQHANHSRQSRGLLP